MVFRYAISLGITTECTEYTELHGKYQNARRTPAAPECTEKDKEVAHHLGSSVHSGAAGVLRAFFTKLFSVKLRGFSVFPRSGEQAKGMRYVVTLSKTNGRKIPKNETHRRISHI
ncbi:hypothetical protein McpCs1_00940 [Methanocorpusculaceae archaeon Cs1]|uniref:Uncharacterized protein n=1 Tax=Methanorbis rubei TaxID=3028300 RepID=A0AAE4MEC8_9EURY|nr:hypothetical protein [Methanocorpusculaceae archaeon Cs1]